MKICFFVPLRITAAQDIYMANMQSRFFAFAQNRFKEKGIDTFSIMTIDGDATGNFDELYKGSGTDCLIDIRTEKNYGIVAPTLRAIEAADNIGCDIFIRITQDTQVLDFDKFQATILSLVNTNKPFIAGGCDSADISQYLQILNLPNKNKNYAFVQGNVIIANFFLWKKYFPQLPKEINHYSDDSVFSYLIEYYEKITPTFLNAQSGWRPSFRTSNISYYESFYNNKENEYLNMSLTDRYFDYCSGTNPEALDICWHLPILRYYASQVDTIVEFGVRFGGSTVAFLMGKPKRLRSYDINDCTIEARLKPLRYQAIESGTDFEFEIANSHIKNIEPCDLLFIDTIHTYEFLAVELKKHHTKALKWIICHDTVHQPSLLDAIKDFCSSYQEWTIHEHYRGCNGLCILRRISNT